MGLKMKLTKSDKDLILNQELPYEVKLDVLKKIFNRELDDEFFNELGTVVFDNKRIKDSLAEMGVDCSLPEAREILVDSFFANLKDQISLGKLKPKSKTEPKKINEYDDKYPDSLEKTKTNKKTNDNSKKIKTDNKSKKKPSFPWWKSFLRFFNKNLFREEYENYQRNLKTYNIVHKKDSNKDVIVGEKKQFKSEYAVSALTAFPNLRVIDENDDLDLYAEEIMVQRTGLELNEHNAELIVLGSFNLDELNDVKAFINGKPELEHLNKVIDHKLNKLSDERIVNKATPLAHDITVDMKARTYYITQAISGGFIEDLKYAVDNGLSPYEALSNESSIYINDKGSNKSPESRMNAVKDITNSNELSKTQMKVKTKEERGSFVLTNIPKTEVQTTDNGCWSCSLGVLLKHENVNLNQQEIRGFRPDTKVKEANDFDPVVHLKERLNFVKRVSFDVFNEINDYTDIIHKKVDNVAFKSKQISGNARSAYNEIERVLRENKTPISLLYNGHYRTIIGVDNGNLILEDSLVGKNFNENYYRCNSKAEADRMKSRYPNNSVQNISLFSDNNPIVISWIEKIKENDPIKYVKDNLVGMDEEKRIFRNEGRSFTKNTIDEINGTYIQEDIILPKKYLNNIPDIEFVFNGGRKQVEVEVENNGPIVNSNNQEISTSKEIVKEDDFTIVDINTNEIIK